MTIKITFANVEADIGRFFVVTREDDKPPHRRPVVPGRFTDATTWVDTDVSGEDKVIQDLVHVDYEGKGPLWTQQVIDAYKAKFPWVAPKPPTPEQIRDATFKANADRIDMINRLRNATPAQIKTYITANVTNLAQARDYLEKLTLVLATAIRD